MKYALSPPCENIQGNYNCMIPENQANGMIILIEDISISYTRKISFASQMLDTSLEKVLSITCGFLSREKVAEPTALTVFKRQS